MAGHWRPLFPYEEELSIIEFSVIQLNSLSFPVLVLLKTLYLAILKLFD